MTYVIIVTNTWTKKQRIHPELYTDIEVAEKAKRAMEDSCSSTGKFKNNSFNLVNFLK